MIEFIKKWVAKEKVLIFHGVRQVLGSFHVGENSVSSYEESIQATNGA